MAGRGAPLRAVPAAAILAVRTTFGAGEKSGPYRL